MPFITQGKTNLKYILIVGILAVIACGGILGYLWWAQKEKVAPAELPTGKEHEIETLVSECEKINPAEEVERTLCFINLGREGDLNLCNKVQDIRERGYCYGGVAGVKKDLTVCDSFGELDFWDSFERGDYTPAETAWTVRRNIPSYLVEYYSRGGSADIVMFLNSPVFGEQESFAWGMGAAIGDPCYVGAAVTQEGLTISELGDLSPWSSPFTIKNVAILLAVIKKDPKICEDTVNFLEKKLPETGYNYMADDIKEEFLLSCYSTLAVELRNTGICDKIPETTMNIFTGGGKSTCVSLVAQKLENPEICQQITSAMFSLYKGQEADSMAFSAKGSCYFMISEKKPEFDACNKIKEEIKNTYPVESQDFLSSDCRDISQWFGTTIINPELSNFCETFNPEKTYFSQEELYKILPDCFTTIKNPSNCEKFNEADYKELCYYNVGLNLKNIEICESKLTDQKFREECYLSLSKLLKNEALCEKIQDDETKKMCLTDFIKLFEYEDTGKILEGKMVNICEGISDQRIKDGCYSEAARAKKDINLCDRIKDQHEKNWCYYEVIVFEKVDLKDPAICRNITEYKDDCYTNIAKITGDVNICNNLDGKDKENCYIEVAKVLKDKSLCEKVETPQSKEWCYISLAEVLKDENLCQKAKDDHSKSQCYLGVAKAKKNPILCEQISYPNVCNGMPTLRDDCYDWFAIELKDPKFCDKMEC